MVTPGCRNEFIDCQKAKVRIAVLLIMDVKTRWNSTLELLERAYRLREFTREWLQNPKYSEHRPLFTTQDKLVLATVPGYPDAVRVWNRTGWSSLGCYPENRGTHRVRGWVRTGPRFHFTVPTTLAPIKYLSSNRIMTWSIRKWFSCSRSITSCIQICNLTDIR